MSWELVVPVAKCPDCGYIYGDQLEYRFPQPSMCSCGAETENTTVADIETVRALANGDKTGEVSVE